MNDAKRWAEALAHIAQLETRINKALDFAVAYGNIDGGHHKMWVIDQMVKALMGDDYVLFIIRHNQGEDDSNTYEWDRGIAP